VVPPRPPRVSGHGRMAVEAADGAVAARAGVRRSGAAAREVRGPEAEDRRSQGTVGAFAREGERCGGGGPPRTALLRPLPTGRGQVAGLGPSRGESAGTGDGERGRRATAARDGAG